MSTTPSAATALALATLVYAGCNPESCRCVKVDIPDVESEPDITTEPIPDVIPEPVDTLPPPPDWGDAPPIPPIEPDENEKIATDEEWGYLTDPDRSEQVLADAKVAWGRSKPKIKNIARLGDEARAIRFKLLLDPEEGENFWAQYKVRQTNYYFEWKREIHAYRIGKLIHVPVVPAIERRFPRKPFDRFAPTMTEEDYTIVKWEGSGGVRGSLRYWVESLFPRKIGARVCDEEYMTEIATALHPANADTLGTDDYLVYRQMGRAMIFDYLILNDDRARNLGTVTSPDGVRHLILIDNGLAFGLQTSTRKKAKGYFELMNYFPKSTIDALRDLTEEEVMAIIQPKGDNVLSVKDKPAKQLWQRRTTILERVDELHAKWGDGIYYGADS